MKSISGKWLLNDMAVIQFEGPDAADFLHAQITNSVLKMSIKQAIPAGYCNAKGRLLANGILVFINAEKFYYLIAKDLVDKIILRLKMFVLRSKVKITKLDNINIYGILGQENLPKELPTMSDWQTLNDSAGLWVKGPGKSLSAWYVTDLVIDTTNEEKDHWYFDMLANGWPLIRLNSSEKFLTSTLNMDLNGSIDFNKGCYPGQEIIARSHYRGTVKRRLAFGEANLNTGSITDSDELYAANDTNQKPVGRVIESVVINDFLFISAEVNVADVSNTQYIVGLNGPTISNMRLISE